MDIVDTAGQVGWGRGITWNRKCQGAMLVSKSEGEIFMNFLTFVHNVKFDPID